MHEHRRDRERWTCPRPTRVVAALTALSVVALLIAPGTSIAEPRAKSSASVKKQVKKLKKQFKQLQQQLEDVAKQQGPQGAPGAQGAPGPQGSPGSADAWGLTGNATANGASFLGTTNDAALNVRVNNARVLRLEPAFDGTNQSPNVIGGIADNAVTAGVHSATIGGGGRDTPTDPATANRVTDNQGTVGGGADNQAGDDAGTASDARRATVGGGHRNTAGGPASTIAGGEENIAGASDSSIGGGTQNVTGGQSAAIAGGDGNEALGGGSAIIGGGGNEASGSDSTVGGGSSNDATATRSTVGGGAFNVASGLESTVPGGNSSAAAGSRSFAAGTRAKANHTGTFVWGDNAVTDIASSEDNQFIARAAGGFFLQDDSTLDDQGGFINTSTDAFLSTTGVWQSTSDEDKKQGFEQIDHVKVLEEVVDLPVTSWAYKADPDVRHIGPTGQDFYAAFGIGEDERSIGTVDADGVALAAIKGLNERVESLERELAELRGDR